MRRARHVLVPAIVAALAVTLAACGNSAPASPISDPAAVLSGIPAAATHAGSVHFVEVTTSAGVRTTLTGALSASSTGDAGERLVQGTTEFDLERIGVTIFLRGPAAVLESALGFSATQATPYAGKWISVDAGDYVFQTLTATLDLSSQVKAFVPTGTQIQAGAQRTLRDTAVVPIAGAPPTSTAGGARGDLTLFVSANSPHLPAGATLALTKGKQTETRVVAFTHWGQPIHLTEPTGAVSYRSIATAPAG